MHIITKRDAIKNAIKSFRESYGEGSWGADSRGRLIGSELAALDAETVTTEEVNQIIGNASWTHLCCDECGSTVEDVIIEVGQEPDYESATARLCTSCVIKAALFLGVGVKGEN